MSISVQPVAVDDILSWRDLYRREMDCQIVHDNMHVRRGWTQLDLIEIDGAAAGYGSVLIGGPWAGTRTAFEFYLAPPFRSFAFACFEMVLNSSHATGMEIQTNDTLITVMLHAFARNIGTESLVFADRLTTQHRIDGTVLTRRTEPEEHWAVEIDGRVAATGGILYHYNRPYGDIYMEVAESFRRRGFGSYLVQELKRICRKGGSIPCARCNPANLASRRTLQKAGFVPCAAILTGTL
jgi:GNAT superfamily N-acetyltransferase